MIAEKPPIDNLLPSRSLDGRLWGTRQTLAAASGVGYEVTQPGRSRRALGVITGLMAAADRHLDKQTLGSLREICRMHDRQSPLFSGLLNRALDNIVGANFDFIPNTGDLELNKRAKDYITARMEPGACDAAGVLDFSDQLKTTLRALWTDGDIVHVKRPDGTLLSFEADQVETPTAAGGKHELTAGRRVVLGVDLNPLNRPLRYYLRQRQVNGDYGTGPLNQDWQTAAAADVICPAYRTRFHQTRGVPFLAASLGFYTRFHNYLDFESFAAEQNSMQGWKITRQPREDDPSSVLDNDDGDSTFEKLEKMDYGMIFDLLPGEDVKMIASERPGSNFEPYIITCCRIIGVGIGMPLELVLLDFSQTNYSSARASLGEARRSFRGWQRRSQNQFCLPWYRWQIARGIARGELPARPELFKARCQWPAWEYIDPVKEAQGNAIAISTVTKTPSECIRERGGEPEEVYEEFASDLQRIRGMGLELPNVQVVATTPTDEPQEKPTKKGDKK